MSWKPEYKLLLDCCRHSSIDSRQKGNRDRVINWQTFFALAVKESVISLTYKKIRQSELHQLLPAKIKAQFQKQYYGTAAVNAAIFDDLAILLQLLDSHDINAVVLKGALLAVQVYEDRALRPMDDVDLLVRKEDVALLHQILTAANYVTPDKIDFSKPPEEFMTSVNYYAPSVSKTNFHIHWHLINSTIPNSWSVQAMDMAQIWHDVIRIEIAGISTFAMAPHHQIIHLAEHSLRVPHSLNKLGYLADIDHTIIALQNEIDWQKVITASRRFNLDRFISMPLRLSVQLLGTPIPEDILSSLAPSKMSVFESIFFKSAANNIRITGLSYLLHLANRQGLKQKLFFILQTLSPPKQVLAIRFGIRPEEIRLAHYVKRYSESFGTLAAIFIKAFRKGLSIG